MFIVLRAQIVRVILGSGQFNWTDSRPYEVGDTVSIPVPWPFLVRLAARLSGVNLPPRYEMWVATSVSSAMTEIEKI